MCGAEPSSGDASECGTGSAWAALLLWQQGPVHPAEIVIFCPCLSSNQSQGVSGACLLHSFEFVVCDGRIDTAGSVYSPANHIRVVSTQHTLGLVVQFGGVVLLLAMDWKPRLLPRFFYTHYLLCEALHALWGSSTYYGQGHV